MKFFVVALSLFAVAATAPTKHDAAVKARRRLPAMDREEIHDEFGQFALRYITPEGSLVSERGRLVPTSNGTAYVMVVEGEVLYIGDDGQTYVTKYTSHPVSATAEPITVPELIVAAKPVEVISESFKRVAERLY